MKTIFSWLFCLAITVSTLYGAEAQAVTYSVSGSISGLAVGKTVVLKNNTNTVLVSSTSSGFTFPAQSAGTGWNVAVAIQPSGQVCSVTNGSGTNISTNISNVAVTCAATYTVGGTVTGLTSGALVLRMGTITLVVNSGASTFKFASGVKNATAYNVLAAIQPSGFQCTINNGSGVISGSNVSNIAAECVRTYQVGGTIIGLSSSGLTLKLTYSCSSISGYCSTTRNIQAADRSFIFYSGLKTNNTYEVSILDQPLDQICLVTNGPGQINVSNVRNISVICGMAVPVAPVPTLYVDRNIKQITLTWPVVVGATRYEITKGSTDSSVYIQVCQSNASLLNQCLDAYEKITDVISANYKVAACNSNGCSVSEPINAFSARDIQYIKAAITSSFDAFGWSVALSKDGNTLAVGSLGQASEGLGAGSTSSNSGSVSVYERKASGWVQKAVLLPSNGAPNNQFGSAVSLSADGAVLAVGARALNSNSGAAYVFSFSNGEWIQTAYIAPPNGSVAIWFGDTISLSLDGKTLAIGSLQENSASVGINGDPLNYGANNAGAVYVYVANGNDWLQQAYIKASNTDSNDFFSRSIDISGDGNTLAVGAALESSSSRGINQNQNDNSAQGSGAVYVFVRNGTVWSQQAYIKSSNSEAGDNFGWSVSLSTDGNFLAVGAHAEDSSVTGIGSNQLDNVATDSGAVYLFSRHGEDWLQDTYIKASNTEAGDWFGRNVALSGDATVLAVSARNEDSAAIGINGNQFDNSAMDSGAVYLFRRQGDKWVQNSYVKASNTGAGDYFIKLSISEDGCTLAVGAWREASASTGINGDQTDNSMTIAGAVYVY